MASRSSATVQRGRQVVVVIGVARSAGHVGMPIGEWKARRAVVKTCRRPTHSCMAYRTVRCCKLRTRRGVYRIIRLLPGRQMATRVPAIGRRGRQVIVVIGVARSAGHVGMPIGQQKTGCGVVESCRRPTCGRMARCAIRQRKSRPSRWMHGIRGLLPSRQMTT